MVRLAAGVYILLTTAGISSVCCHVISLIHNVLGRFVGSTNRSLLHHKMYGEDCPVLLELLMICRMP